MQDSFMELLEKVHRGEISPGDAEKAINEERRKEREAIEKGKMPYCKVSQKGACSVYNLGMRMPVTLYPNGWYKLMEFCGASSDPAENKLLAFLQEHEAEFSTGRDDPRFLKIHDPENGEEAA